MTSTRSSRRSGVPDPLPDDPLASEALLERHQVPVYFAAVALGVLAGTGSNAVSEAASAAVLPALAALLYVTFIGIPFVDLRAALTDRRFLVLLLAVNFAAVPLVVWPLLQFAPDDVGVRLGIALVLLAPCTDWVFAFTAMARGSARHLIVNAPVLLLVQIATLPLLVWLLVGAEGVRAFEAQPFLLALLVVIAVPLVLAVLTEAADRRPAVRAWRAAMARLPVVLLALVIALVVASEAPRLESDDISTIAGTIPVFVAFAAIMATLVTAFARRGRSRLAPAESRALLFSAVSRNSFVVLPIALALPAALAIVPLVVVTQSLVELLILIALVRLVPNRLLPDDD